MINYISYEYGSNKAPSQVGDMFASSLNMGASNPAYSSSLIDGEILGTADSATTKFETNVQWSPVVPGTVTVVCGGVTAADHDLTGKVNSITGGVGTITGTGISAGTINYNTGLISITFNTAPDTDPIATYRYNNEEVSVAGNGQTYQKATQIPEVNLKITSLPVVAVSRKLKAVYAFDA